MSKVAMPVSCEMVWNSGRHRNCVRPAFQLLMNRNDSIFFSDRIELISIIVGLGLWFWWVGDSDGLVVGLKVGFLVAC